jgi:hypothetical protein
MFLFEQNGNRTLYSALGHAMKVMVAVSVGYLDSSLLPHQVGLSLD